MSVLTDAKSRDETATEIIDLRGDCVQPTPRPTEVILSVCESLRRRREAVISRSLEAQRVCLVVQPRTEALYAQMRKQSQQLLNIAPLTKPAVIKKIRAAASKGAHDSDPLFNRSIEAANTARELKKTTERILASLKEG